MTQARRRGRPALGDAPAAPEDQLMAAALHAFATQGYEGVSLRILSRELGVSHNLINQRFGSKAALWQAAVDWGFGRMVSELEAIDDPQADAEMRLHRFITTFVVVSSRYPDLLNLINIEASTHSHRLDYVREHFIEPRYRALQPILDDLASHHRIRTIPVETLYFLITAGGASLFGSRALAVDLFHLSADQLDVTCHAEAVADTILHGLMR